MNRFQGIHVRKTRVLSYSDYASTNLQNWHTYLANWGFEDAKGLGMSNKSNMNVGYLGS